jgi:hypothetical protein
MSEDTSFPKTDLPLSLLSISKVRRAILQFVIDSTYTLLTRIVRGSLWIDSCAGPVDRLRKPVGDSTLQANHGNRLRRLSCLPVS